MLTALSIIPLAFAAFCVWLAVRVFNRRERWAKRMLAGVVGLPALYFASFGPACWITSRMKFGQDSVTLIYRPITRTFFQFNRLGVTSSQQVFQLDSDLLSDALKWFTDLGAADHWGWGAIILGDVDRMPREIIWTWTDDLPPPLENFRTIWISRTAAQDDPDEDDPDESTP